MEKEKSIQVAISPLLASCLQRLLVDEIDNQNEWQEEDEQRGLKNHLNVRAKIVIECNDLINDLEKQGIPRHFKCY